MVDKQHQARIERLSRRNRDGRPSASSSRFVRVMRLLLPLAAIGVIAALFTMNGMDEDVIVPKTAQQKTENLPKEIVQNELLNPKFESRDKKNNPYEIVAARAVQGKTNKDLVMLEKPVGTMTMSDGKTIKVTSNTGAYRQDTERFYLDGGVHIEQSEGYTLESEEAHMDLQQRIAWSEKDVSGKGPDMEIEAKGLKADAKTGEILFTGPAKLVLKKGFEGFQ
jgi:lipopolysaccharide export system protein LptC